MHLKWFFLLLLAFPALSIAGDVNLAWDHSVGPDVLGYKLYIGKASQSYWSPIVLPYQTTYTISGLAPGTYFISVTAFNGAEESEHSNEITATVEAYPFAITSSSASLRWFGVVLQCTTSQKANAILRFSKIDPGAGTSTVIVTTGFAKTKHQAVLYLPSGSAYYRYEWEASDATGSVQKQSGTFQTR